MVHTPKQKSVGGFQQVSEDTPQAERFGWRLLLRAKPLN